MSTDQILQEMLNAATKQVDLNDKVITNHLDRIDRISLRMANEAIVSVAKELTTNPT